MNTSRFITYDETKRLANLKKHGLDFIGCETIFDGPVLTWEDDRFAYGEQRINLIGWWRTAVVFMTYTEQGDTLHIISLRRATTHEIKAFARWFSNDT
ncbi:hypothetical protein CKO09_00275 [Chromatium weissei]|nr:hypothetical protein [Chromatium weissei]